MLKLSKNIYKRPLANFISMLSLLKNIFLNNNKYLNSDYMINYTLK